MDEDAVDESGFEGLAWYALGRISARSDGVRSKAVDSIASAFQGQPLGVNDLAMQNQALINDNAELRHQLAIYKHNYRRLKEWADEAEQKLQRLGALGD